MLSDAADVADGVPGRGWARGQTACELEGGVGVNWEVSRDWRFQPAITLLKQEGLQLAEEASFRDIPEEVTYGGQNVYIKICLRRRARIFAYSFFVVLHTATVSWCCLARSRPALARDAHAF